MLKTLPKSIPDSAAWPNGKASDYDSDSRKTNENQLGIRKLWVRTPSWSFFANFPSLSLSFTHWRDWPYLFGFDREGGDEVPSRLAQVKLRNNDE